MEKLNYESRTDRPEPIGALEYRLGCLPALAGLMVAMAAVAADVALFVGAAAGQKVNPENWSIAVCLVIIGWIPTVMVLKRPNGAWSGISLAVLQVAASEMVIQLLLQGIL